MSARLNAIVWFFLAFAAIPALQAAPDPTFIKAGHFIDVVKAKPINTEKLQWLRKAIAAGVKIAYGTDAGVFPHGENGKDFKYLVQSGMTPMQAIQAATREAATLIGHPELVGSISPGRFADVMAVTVDPLKDISVLEKPAFVMKSGVVYRNELETRQEKSRKAN